MTPFTTLTSVAAVLEEDDIDTDIIFPARFLLLLDKTGLGRHAFHERRHGTKGGLAFVLDRPPFDKARIFLAGKNFGSGSSREQAVWALADFGIRCIVAPSFGEIFLANCFKNGVLPIALGEADLAALRGPAAAGGELTVDLEAQTVAAAGGPAFGFAIDAGRKAALLGGLDEIGAILAEDEADIRAFEARHHAVRPWLRLDAERLRHFDDLETESGIG